MQTPIVPPPRVRTRRDVVWSLVGVSLLFAGSVALAQRFGGGLSGAIIGIIASIMTPALGGLLTLLVVTPLRAITAEAREIHTISENNGVKIDGVKTLVDDGMTALIEQIAEVHATTVKLSEEVAKMQQQLDATSPVSIAQAVRDILAGHA